MGHELRVRRLRSRRAPRSLRRQLRRVRRQDDSRARDDRQLPLHGDRRLLRAEAADRRPRRPLPQQRRRHVLRRHRSRRREGSRLLRLRRRLHRSQRRRVAGYLRGERLGAEPAVPQSRQWHVRRGRPGVGRRAERRRASAGRHGRRCRRLQRRRTSRPHRHELLSRLQHAVRERSRGRLHRPQLRDRQSLRPRGPISAGA